MKITENINKKITKYRFVFLFYLFVSTLIFIKMFFSAGSVVGSDWGFPDNFDQLRIFYDSLFHSWTHAGNLFGTRQLSTSSIFVMTPLYLLTYIGVPIALTIKLLLIFIFALGAANMNLFLRYIGLKKLPAFVGGAIFIFSPIFFNYTLIGWLYVLLSLALLPLFIYLFLRFVEEGSYRLAVVAAIVFTIASVQSQTIIWYPLVVITLVLVKIRQKHQFLAGIKFGVVVAAVFLILNLYWLLPMVLYPSQGVIGNNLVKSSISLGTSQRLATYNLLRTWGGLFNYQFETSYPGFLRWLSFLVAGFGLSSLLLYKIERYRKHLAYLLFIFLVPIGFYYLDRQIISSLPFSNLIRDVARFSVLSTFALSAMITIMLDGLYDLKFKNKSLILSLIILALFLNIYPFWSGNLYSTPVSGFDFRMRTKVWPSEYQELNQKLSAENPSEKALFLPLGGLVSLSNDWRYHGAFREIVDVYSGYSPLPATVSFSDRSYGVSTEIISQINQAIEKQNIDKLKFLLVKARINFLVLRRDMDYYDWDDEEKSNFEKQVYDLADNDFAGVYFDQGEILAIKVNDSVLTVSAADGLVEVASNSEKILSNYVDLNYFDPKIINQLEEFPQIFDIFSCPALITFDGRNSMFSQFVPSKIDGYNFVSLSRINEKLMIDKWNYRQDNLNPKLDQGLKDENQEMISSFESSPLSDANNQQYVAYLNDALHNPEIYFNFRGNNLKVKVNGKDYLSEARGGDIAVLTAADLPKGYNLLETEDKNLVPILIKSDSQSSNLLPGAVAVEKKNASEYAIKISGVRSDFYIEFAENFDKYWKLYKNDGELSQSAVPESDHFVSNGYGNGYRMVISDLEENGALQKNSDGTFSGEFRLYFQPERISLPASAISLAAFFVAIAFILVKGKNENIKK